MSHLKANNQPADETQRQTEVTAFCTDIASLPQSANIILAGDMNLKASTEPAFITLSTNACSHVFYDPVNQPGAWNNNSTFSKIFTQSTRSSSNPGCCGGSTGGLDDRFDLLLVTNNVMSGSQKAKYLYGSYKAYGNDNQHMNLAIINAPTNTVVTASVAQSLFNMSDHLPVMMKVVLLPSANGIRENDRNDSGLKVWGVQGSGNSLLGVSAYEGGSYDLKVIDLTGKIIATIELELKAGYQTYELGKLNLSNGIYHVLLSNNKIAEHCLLSISSDQ
jgi:hypothetical protein